MPCSCTARAGTKIAPHALASARSPGRAEPMPRCPTWTMRSTCAISEARRMVEERPKRSPATSSRQSMWASIWTMVSGPRSWKASNDRDRHRIVAADDDRDGTPCDHGGDRLTNGGTVRSRVRLGAGEVAAIDRGDRVREDRPADVEVDVVEVGRIAGDRSADRFRRAGAIGPDRSVRGRAGHAEDGDLRFQRLEILGAWQPQEGFGLAGAEQRAEIGASSHSRAVTVISTFDPPARPPDWVQVRAGRAPLGKNRA